MRIAIDTLGSDNPPEVIIRGAIQGFKEFPDIELHLVGNEAIIRKVLKEEQIESFKFFIHHTTEYISMNDEISKVIKKKKNSSMIKAILLQKENLVDAVFSPGNTGAFMSASLLYLGRLKGVKRPGIAIPFPRYDGMPTVLIDAGANVYVKPEYLVQFAIMGEIYYREIFAHNLKPKIGILSNGEEEIKGTDITKKAYQKMLKTELNFVGYVEGRDLFGLGKPVDVVVTDGFTGNIVLKTAEGLSKLIFTALKEAIYSSVKAKLGALLMKKAFSGMKERFDHESYGGAPLLGINGICIVGHGTSTEKSVKNAIRVARELVNRDINRQIVYHIKEL